MMLFIGDFVRRLRDKQQIGNLRVKIAYRLLFTSSN